MPAITFPVVGYLRSFYTRGTVVISSIYEIQRVALATKYLVKFIDKKS